MNLPEGDVKHPDAGVEPLQNFHHGDKQSIPGVSVAHMGQFVKHHRRVRGAVGLANHDAMHPTEGTHLAGMAIDGGTVALVGPQTSAGDEPQESVELTDLQH